ncbi:thiamine phosphate synthase [Aggregatibacter aphrophilus]|uniref:Thiamine-phosphate synthase n=2 Tax=Aggregatibacter aphrophilus TaxID=732 RepID=A0A336N4A2_AGGAP|nr:thiamine phosphate synthase [Aggregatibacter aphrophilus]OBY51568.1 thiamine-phosphate diphosphorylase [Aggregatibacter aphrophilus]RDE87293.1 thiamine phosphate synthase [Aggregatibacter aphrophilus]SSY94692.1 Thiamine-phosphate synthase [Aggregatibacter aphrophilus]VEF41135.1 Thiamine-phosphate synthase [Aggregatibacter aphrophilus ATCC 33389]
MPTSVSNLAEIVPPNAPFAPTEFKLGLYVIVDSYEWIERLIHASVKTLQIRIKDRSPEQAEEEIARCIALAKQHQVRLFVDDFWQLAIKYQAYGVHLGQEDLLTADLNAIQQAGLRLGVSTHNREEIELVLPLRPSYIALGHIFPTQSKIMPSAPQGIANLAAQVKDLGDIPTVAIGGITASHFADVLATGVSSIAVISAVTQAEDWQSAVKNLLNYFDAS